MSDFADGTTLRPRRATAADAPRLAALSRAAYAASVELIGGEPEPYGADYAALLRDQEAWLVPGEDDALDGAVVLRRARDHILLWSVAVAPQRQHAGLGRQLID